MIYEIRRSGVTLCQSSVPNLGYTPGALKDMARNGLHLYCGGKKVKAASGAGTSESGNGKQSTHILPKGKAKVNGK